MSRYRPPAEPRSRYITGEGYQRLNDELYELWAKRRRTTKKLAEAAAEGDRSENADYIYRKKQLREMDRRIRYLSRRVDGITVVDRIPTEQNKVYFGAWVTVETDDCQCTEYRIVGPDEFDAKLNWISMDSAMGKALLGKQLDDEISIKLAETSTNFCIVAIRYQ